MSFGISRKTIVKEYLTVVKYCDWIVKALVKDREGNLIEKTYASSITNLI